MKTSLLITWLKGKSLVGMDNFLDIDGIERGDNGKFGNRFGKLPEDHKFFNAVTSAKIFVKIL